jgi:plastocyanin
MAKIVVHSIIIRSNGYDPSVLEIPVGDHVLWKNEDGETRTVTSIDHLFDSGEIKHDDTYVHTFNEAGSFKYYDRLGTGPRGVAISGIINVT